MQVYPTGIRGSGLGLAASIGRLTSILSPIVGAFLRQQSLEAPLIVFAACFLCAGVTSLSLRIETSGRVLEDHVNPESTQMKQSALSSFTRIPT
jgi:putative MFS transporter